MIRWIKMKYWLYEQIEDEADSNGHAILPGMSDGSVILDNEYVQVAINEIKKETEKACLIEFTEAARSGRNDSYKRWVPKSQIIIVENEKV